jgi:hypothetical protein
MWGELRAEADKAVNELYDGLVNGIPEKELAVKKEELKAEYKKKGYYVGSGAIESGNKVVVQGRCKQAGMMQDEKNAHYTLALRAKTESGLWASRVQPLIVPATAPKLHRKNNRTQAMRPLDGNKAS